MKLKMLLSLFLLFASINSCQKIEEDFLYDDLPPIADEPIIEEPPAKGPAVYSSYFDWENITEIQTGSGRVVTMPWYGETFVPDRMKTDYYKSDGWELLYNTLDINDIENIPTIMALYNKYSGLLRIFYTDHDLESATHFYAAASINNSTSLLNFEGKYNYEYSFKDYCPWLVKGVEGTFQLNSTSGSTEFLPDGGFVSGNWYCTEIEFSYEDVSSFSDSDLRLKYLPFRADNSTLVITGEIIGSIKGAIEAKSSSTTNLLGAISNTYSDTDNTVEINTTGDVSRIVEGALSAANEKATVKFLGKLWTKIKKDIPTAVQSNVSGILTNALNLGMKWASNPLSGFISKIFSTGGTSTSKVDLTLNAEISLTGSISNQKPNMLIDFKLPNTAADLGGYFYPTQVMKNWNLGVWNVVDLPTVNYDVTNTLYRIGHTIVRDPQSGEVRITIPDASQANIIVNPMVENDCYVSLTDIKYIIETSSSDNKIFLDNCNFEPFSFKDGSYPIQGYILPIYGVGMQQPYPLRGNCGFKVYARVAVILTHKTTGKEYESIKDFPLDVMCYSREIVTDLEVF